MAANCPFGSLLLFSFPVHLALTTMLLPVQFDRAHAQESRTMGRIELRDPAAKQLLDADTPIEILAEGFQWSEGPVWLAKQRKLLFSDVPRNRIHAWTSHEGASVFMSPSGFDPNLKPGQASNEKEPGSNGLMLDHDGRLLVCDHGNRRVYRVEKDGSKTTLIDLFEGKRFNSPNDLIVHSNGDIYFTDPPYGLRDKTKRELDFCGVYRLRLVGDGNSPHRNEVTLITKDLERPNGIALSPDEKTLYVAQSHRPAPTYTRYDLNAESPSSTAKVLYDASDLAATDPGMPDGMAVDQRGNLWATGPGGVLIISPTGKLLGRIVTGQPTANCTFGGAGNELFITSGKQLLRVKTRVKGLNFPKVGR